jgi:hypothetical protein
VHALKRECACLEKERACLEKGTCMPLMVMAVLKVKSNSITKVIIKVVLESPF